jgi:hypothetical protein
MKMKRISVSADRRRLVTEDDRPFFWMGDTAWELIHRLDRKEAERFLEDRRRKGFNVIQTVILAELEGLTVPNVQGDCPLEGNDPDRPNERYFRYVDHIVDLCGRKGMYAALLPTWADKVVKMWGVGPVVFNEQNARTYGRFLGERYRKKPNVLWVLGGDRPAEHEGVDYRPIWTAMAAGLDEGSGLRGFKTYHPRGGSSSSEWLKDAEWLDMHMIQSGHGLGRDYPVWEMIGKDLALDPRHPTLDAEPNYEDHPVNAWPKWESKNGYFRDHDVRKQLYRSVFAGGCGVTYGHHHVWQMWDKGRKVNNNGDELFTWREAMGRPASFQVRHLRSLMESRDMSDSIPDQTFLLSDAGEAGRHVRALRDSMGRWAMVYLPLPLPVRVDLRRMAGVKIRISWFDPVSGETIPAGTVTADSPDTFTPPGHRPDWVFCLDAEAIS